jgi:hypothetical protein
MLNRFFSIAILLVLSFIIMNGQVTEKNRVIQVTGIISNEENNPVPGVSIISHKLRRGTVSELSGIYNIISIPGDTIWFSALGYKNASITVPSDIDSRQITKDIHLLNDTIVIKDVVILPWKNYEEFKRAVLAAKNIKPEIINMYDNLALIQNSILNTHDYKVTPEAGYRMSMQQNADALYTRGQFPANNLLNPFAWAKLFSGIKNGLLKNQKSDQPESTKAKIKKKKKKADKNKDKDKDKDKDQGEKKPDKTE